MQIASSRELLVQQQKRSTPSLFLLSYNAWTAMTTNNNNDGDDTTQRFHQEAASKSYQIFLIVNECVTCIFIIFSILLLLSVLLSFKKLKRSKQLASSPNNNGTSTISHVAKNWKRSFFMQMTQYSIFHLLFFDLLFMIFYLPCEICRLFFEVYFLYMGNITTATSPASSLSTFPASSTSLSTTVLVGGKTETPFIVNLLLSGTHLFGQISDAMLFVSGLWSILIPIYIYHSIKYIKSSTNESEALLSQPKQQQLTTTTTNESRWTALLQYKSYLVQHNSGSEQQVDLLKWRHKTLLQVTAWTFIIVSSVGWTIPSIACMLTQESALIPEIPLLVTAMLHDLTKALLFTILEIVGLIYRVVVYFKVKRILSKDMMSVGSRFPNAKRKKREQRRLFFQLSNYSMPFLLCGIWLSVYRFIFGSFYAYSLAKRDAALVEPYMLANLHRFVLPLKGTLDAIVYVLLSKWFMEMVKRNCCFCRSRATNGAASSSPMLGASNYTTAASDKQQQGAGDEDEDSSSFTSSSGSRSSVEVIHDYHSYNEGQDKLKY